MFLGFLTAFGLAFVVGCGEHSSILTGPTLDINSAQTNITAQGDTLEICDLPGTAITYNENVVSSHSVVVHNTTTKDCFIVFAMPLVAMRPDGSPGPADQGPASQAADSRTAGTRSAAPSSPPPHN